MEYGREMENLWDKLPGGMFDPLDCLALYSMIRFARPKVILEIGSLLGRSSCIICHALEMNEEGKLITCDLEDKSKITKKNVTKLFPNSKTEFISGPIEDHEVPECDMVFIDGPHTKEFMKWCIENVIIKVRGFVLIHDMNISYNFNIRSNGDSEADYLLELAVKNKLPLLKVSFLEDWCLNHNFKEARNVLFNDFPIIGEWGIVNRPNAAGLSIWKKDEIKPKSGNN